MNNFNIYAFADESSNNFDEQISAMLKNNLKGIEIRNLDEQNIVDISDEKAKEVKSKLDDNNLVCWSIGSPIGKIDIVDGNFEEHLEKLKRTLEITNILGCDKIRMFSFFMPKETEDFSIYKNEVIDRLGKMIDIADSSKIMLCHENEKGIYGDIASRCLEIYKALPKLKAVFDPANYVQSGQDTLEAWDMLSEYIYYMHIKDSLTNSIVVPAGMGAGNVKQIVDKFIAMGGKDFTMEPHLFDFTGLKALEREGEESVIGEKISYANNVEAFDAACNAFKSLL